MSSGSTQNRSDTARDPLSSVCPAGAASHGQSGPSQVMLEISVPRDLAVQLIGSDAGKKRRMRPHRVMTKGAEPDESVAVEAVMKPFLDREIDRVHSGSRPAAKHVGTATPEQALSLKKFCLRFATSLKKHLADKGDDDRHHRSKQRLNQAWDVINQINRALDLPPDDGKGVQEVVEEILADARCLRGKLEGLQTRVGNATGVSSQGNPATPPHQLIELIGPLDQFLRRFAPSDSAGSA